MNGRLVAGDEDRYVTGFSIDSRTLASGDLFFAIVAKRDGHDFAGAASRRRAAGIVVARPVALGDENESFVVEVPDTTKALQDLARFVRRESGAKVVAITGSAGKTTTKDTIAEFIGTKYRVVKNTGNLNNHLGLPLSLLELQARGGCGGDGTGHESRGRNPDAGRRGDAGGPRVDQRRRGAHRLLRIDRRHRGCERRNPGGRVERHAVDRERGRSAGDGAGARVCRPHS